MASGELVKGFRHLRVPVAPGSFITRSFLVKRHASRDAAEKEVADRTLFVTHLDNFTTEAQLSRCFSSAYGQVDKVELKSVEKRAPKAEQRADGVRLHVNFARVVFKDWSSLENAIQAADGRIATAAVLPLPTSALKSQLKAAKSLYRDAGELREEIDDWMASYDAREDDKRRLARESALVDEDGFQKVVSGITRSAEGFSIRSAKRPSLKAGAFSEPIAAAQGVASGTADKRKRKKKEIERPDFYKFQQREKRRDEIMDHRRRKAEDEEKVLRMRKTKRFKAEKSAS
uniref:RRM domain-containing protein n=1 Tax=Zooxanthella nutricula TaxID=1333877 RepID=A0A7S2P3X6_9DINO